MTTIGGRLKVRDVRGRGHPGPSSRPDTEETGPDHPRTGPTTDAGPAAPGGAGGLVNTAAFDVYGLPTVSIPCGFTTSGLPIGLQISGKHFAEPTVLTLAHAYEQATEWHKRRPMLN